MSNTKVEDAILQAIDMIASKRVASAGYNKTIQVTIISCQDENIGKYKAKYQDGIFYVYGDPDTYYGPGQRVQVLVPNGDMSKDKTIMGSVQKLGSGYKTLSNEERIYDTIGRNVILNSEYVSVNLSSYKTYDPPMILYDKSAPQNNVLEIDVQQISEYIKRSSTIALSAKFSTDLETSQRYQGDYGIVLGLNFKDNATEDIITRYYVMNIDTMTGNPYFFPNPVLQTKFFEIDNENFIQIDTISAFAKDFPIKDQQSSLYDIHIRDFSLKCVEILNAEDLQSYSLNLITSKGYIFNSNSLLDDTRTIEAQLRVQSKLVNMDSKEISIYWFIQNVGVTAASQKYNKYGGQGWQCLNQYHVIKQAVYEGNTLVQPRVIEYISGSKIFSVKKSQVLARETKYKCVVLYGGNILSKEITILRKDAEYQIFITSDSGTQFYYDIGSPTLTCSCYHRENDQLVQVDPKDLNFIWGATDSSGVFQSLPNHSSNSDKSKLNGIRLAIEDYLKIQYILFEDNYDVDKIFPSDVSIAQIQDAGIKAGVTTIKNRLKQLGILSTQNITQLFAVYNVDASSSITYSVVLYGDSTHTNNLIRVINSMNDSQTVVNNRIFDVNVRRITGFTVFKCSVFTALGSGFLGTADITITNSLTAESSYSLVINNGTQVFKYNTHGIAPTSKRNQLPLQIPSLTFTIYDGLGRPIEDDIASHCDISWIVPTKRTLLKISDNYNGYPDSSLSNMIYKNLMSFNYNIVEIYNTSATQNNITLKVDYNGMHLITSTNLTFTKQGDDGTNGTDFVCKIVPTVDRGDTPLYPTIYYDGNSITKNWDPGVGNPWFQVQVWNNGNEPIFTGTETGHSTEGKLVTVVKWEVLKNTYSSTKADGTNLTVTAGSSNSNWSFGFSPQKFATETAANWQNWRPANILKVTINYDGHAYYATLPVIVCCYQNSTYQNSYRINLKEYSGFRRVLYNSSGLIPQYDNHAPFEIKVEQQISNGNWEDISTKTKAHSMIYRWYYMGSIWYRTNSTTWVQDYERTIEGANPITNVQESSKKWLLKSNYRDFIEDDNDNTVKELQKNQKSIKPADKYDGQCVNTGLGCKIIRQSDNQIIGWIHIPIHMSFNRFENSAINSWDGNSVNLGGDNGGMILAPQIGAGIKDNNNRFTGLFMGTAKDPSTDSYGNTASTNEDVGLFGYNAGVRTIFLDSKTGKAVFGAQGQSQIILDPSQTDSNGRPIAQIKSGNYIQGNNGSGLMIDLTTPAIKFGSGNFSVDSSGRLYCKGATIQGYTTVDNVNTLLSVNSSNILLQVSQNYSTKQQTQQAISSITIDPDSIRLVTRNLIWSATNSSLDANGHFWCQGADISGQLKIRQSNVNVDVGTKNVCSGIKQQSDGSYALTYENLSGLNIYRNNNTSNMYCTFAPFYYGSRLLYTTKNLYTNPIQYVGSSVANTEYWESYFSQNENNSSEKYCILKNYGRGFDMLGVDESTSSINFRFCFSKNDNRIILGLVAGSQTSGSWNWSYTKHLHISQDGLFLNFSNSASIQVRSGVIYLSPSGTNYNTDTDSAYIKETSSLFSVAVNRYNGGQILTYNGDELKIGSKLVASFSVSSKRYKDNIEKLFNKNLDPHLLLKLPVRQFTYKQDFEPQFQDMKNRVLPGFIAEEVDKYYPSAVVHSKKGQIESWDERRIIPGMLALIQQQNEKINKLQKFIKEIKGE